MTGFQKQVNQYVAVAVEGDFASANPRNSMLAGEGELTAGADGVTIGRFAWARNDNGKVSNAHPVVAARLGFVHRDQPAIITGWLQQDTMLVPEGLEITLFNGGDFWARFAAGATIGQSVYVDYNTGLAIAGASGTPPVGAEFTGLVGASVTAINGVSATAKVGGAVTGAIAANVLTVSAVTASTKLHVGDLLSGPGGASDPVADGTTILAQLTGTAGGTGTYTVSIAQTSTSATITVESEVAVISAIAAGVIEDGMVITGTGWPAGAAILDQLTGTAGSTGDYSLTVPGPFASASGAITAPSTLLTVSAVGSGKLYAGDVLAGTGVATGQTIVSQLTGTAGSTGTYRVSISDYSASGTQTTDSDVLEVTAVASGTIAPGQPISGSSVDTGSFIGVQLSGTTGGIGTYRVAPAQAVASTTITSVGGVDTGWKVQSNCLANELAKIATQV